MSWKNILKQDSNAKLKSFADKLNNYNLTLEEYFRKGWTYEFPRMMVDGYTTGADIQPKGPDGKPLRIPHTEYFETTDEKRSFVPNDTTKYFAIKMKDEYAEGSAANPGIFEYVRVKYEPVPEEVAAKALEFLKNSESTRRGFMEHGDPPATAEIGEYKISRDYAYDYERNINNLRIYKGDELVVVLEWSNGEFVYYKEPKIKDPELVALALRARYQQYNPRTDELEGDPQVRITKHPAKYQEGRDLFTASGYYDGRDEFGQIWHEG
jgi:hypothetical protein